MHVGLHVDVDDAHCMRSLLCVLTPRSCCLWCVSLFIYYLYLSLHVFGYLCGPKVGLPQAFQLFKDLVWYDDWSLGTPAHFRLYALPIYTVPK